MQIGGGGGGGGGKGSSAVLSIRLTRLKPRGPPKAGAHSTFFLLVLNLNKMDMANAPRMSPVSLSLILSLRLSNFSLFLGLSSYKHM